MLKLILFLVLFIIACLEVANLARFLPERSTVFSSGGIVTDQDHNQPLDSIAVKPDDAARTTTAAQFSQSNAPTPPDTQASSSSTTMTTQPTMTTSTMVSTTSDSNADLDDLMPPSTPSVVTMQTPNGPNKDLPDKIANKSSDSPQANINSTPNSTNVNLELNVLLYSIFIVYVSIIKLIYHSVAIIKRNLTEPGMLMIFGIIWELISRQVTTSYDAFPRFNSRIFFYLFLPSTVLESASLLSNKWLFLNLLPILIHSIIGTLFYASSLGFTIYSLSRQNIFNLNNPPSSASMFSSALRYNFSLTYTEANKTESLYIEDNWLEQAPQLVYDKSYATVGSSLELNNLTLADCLVFGTILSSVDSTAMLGIFRLLEVNEKLYYLVLGESLMNNAVVLVIFNLLLDFFNATRLTVVKIYIAIIQFFITLIGSIFIGLFLAGVALVSVRLTKRFQVPSSLTSYQNQCQAMVETLLILKLAYLTYTLASLAGTSSIVSLATFGILQDQYIKHNLNLRSQLTFRQVILATKTLGFSLVYPLLGMLLVEVANASQFFQTLRSSFEPSSAYSYNYSTDITDPPGGEKVVSLNQQNGVSGGIFNAASVAGSKISNFANQANLYWNFKFLSLVILLTVVYRFTVVILLSLLCNLFSSNQLRIKFREQILVAYGGLKGPLAFALVHRLMEQEEYHDRIMRNKHLFMYTILFITFLSTVVKGSFIRPLVARMQLTLCHSSSSENSSSNAVFSEINSKVTEYIAHGLNSILGHGKSPYDRFVELNGTHIKPWLARDGSNTNWLIVFYDNLLLDETLNANSLHKSTALDPTLQSYWHLDNGGNVTRRESNSVQRWRSTQQLDTIDENGGSTSMIVRRQQGASLRPKNSTFHAGSSQRHSSRAMIAPAIVPQTSTSTRHLNIEGLGDNEDYGSGTMRAKNAVLKEFVLFNLKLEEARRRKQLAGNKKTKVDSMSNGGGGGGCDDDDDDDYDGDGNRVFSLRLGSRQRVAKMISSTVSSGELAQETSSIEPLTDNNKWEKQAHLIEMENRLEDIKPGRRLYTHCRQNSKNSDQLSGSKRTGPGPGPSPTSIDSRIPQRHRHQKATTSKHKQSKAQNEKLKSQRTGQRRSHQQTHND